MSQWTCFEFGGKIGANSLHPETLTASIGNTASLMYQQRETPGTIGLGLCPPWHASEVTIEGARSKPGAAKGLRMNDGVAWQLTTYQSFSPEKWHGRAHIDGTRHITTRTSFLEFNRRLVACLLEISTEPSKKSPTKHKGANQVFWKDTKSPKLYLNKNYGTKHACDSKYTPEN